MSTPDNVEVNNKKTAAEAVGKAAEAATIKMSLEASQHFTDPSQQSTNSSPKREVAQPTGQESKEAVKGDNSGVLNVPNLWANKTAEFPDPLKDLNDLREALHHGGGQLTNEQRQRMEEALKVIDSLPQDKIKQALDKELEVTKGIRAEGDKLMAEGQGAFNKLPDGEKVKYRNLEHQLGEATTDESKKKILEKMTDIEPTATKDLQKVNELLDKNKPEFERLRKLINLSTGPINFRLQYADLLIDSGNRQDNSRIAQLEQQAVDAAPVDQQAQVRDYISHLNEEQSKQDQ